MVVRPPGTHPPAVTRSGDDTSIGSPGPPEDLLPSGRALAPAPAPAPDRALALDALHLQRELRGPIAPGGPWEEPAFVREVELVRCHLAPLRSRMSLVASFGREAFHALGTAEADVPPRLVPVRVAYALRWLELGDGRPRPSWQRLLEA
jgi:hypothetical protein